MLSQLSLMLGTLVVLFQFERSVHYHVAAIVILDIHPFVGHPCIRFRNGNFEIVPCQMRFGRLNVPTATRNGLVGSKVTRDQDMTRADGNLGIRITKKEALYDVTSSKIAGSNEIITDSEMIRSQPIMKEESLQAFITRKHTLRVRKADPEMRRGNHRIVAGMEAS